MDKNLIKYNRPSGSYYGIQLTDSKIRKWEVREKERDIVSFNWGSIGIDKDSKDIQISIAKSVPEESNQRIKELSKEFNITRSVEESDKIFGFIGEKIEKIGFITDTIYQANSDIILCINWLNERDIGQGPKNLFNAIGEIQLLSDSKLSKIEKKLGGKLISIYNRLPQSTNLIVKEELESIGEINSRVTIPLNQMPNLDRKVDQGGLIELFYGTNRDKSYTAENLQYGKKEGPLDLGFCSVQIPKGHVQGELEKPGKILIWKLPENEKNHIVIKEINSYEQDAFWNKFNKNLKEHNKKSVLLFVHGYNTTFKDAAKRTAQLSWDLDLKGTSGFFSWPSSGERLAYLEDDAKARSSVGIFEDFIGEILKNHNTEELHIIAHSMGSLLLTLTLLNFNNNHNISPYLPKLKQVILAAPDIDQGEFKNNILPHFNLLGQRRTIYASDHDFALNYSSLLRKKRGRLGQVDPKIFVNQDIDTIEVSNINGVNSHSYIFESKLLLSDIYYLITQGLSPIERRLREISFENSKYWLFPK